MNFWYNGLEVLPDGPGVTQTLEDIPTRDLVRTRDSARAARDYDICEAAHNVIEARKRDESLGVLRGLRQHQALHQLRHELQSEGTLEAVSAMWEQELGRLREAAAQQLMKAEWRHEDEVAKLRLKQVEEASEKGIRAERRSVALRDLRRSEDVLAKTHQYARAAEVKAVVDQVQYMEASDKHMDWLLRCHTQQQQLMARQQRVLEGLRARLERKIREVELARDRDLERLGRRVQATSSLQRSTHASERRDAVAGLRGCLLNTKTTRRGRSVLDAFPTLLAAADQARPGTPRHPSGPAGPGLGASARPSSAPARRSLSGLPSPPPSSGRPPSAGSTMSSSLSFYTSSASSSSRGGSSRPASAASSGRAVAGAGAGGGYSGGYGGRHGGGYSDGYGGGHGGRYSGGYSGEHGTPYLLQEQLYEHTGKKPWDTGNVGPVDVYHLTPARNTTGTAWAAAAQPPPPPPVAAAPSSAAVGSVPSGAAGSGSSGLTEAALQLHQRAMGGDGAVQGRHTSLNSSSFRSNRPYAAGWSAQHFGRPHQEHSPVVPVPVHSAWWAHD